LAQRFGVKGYPTIKYFEYGLPKSQATAKPYEGARDATAIISHANMLLDKSDIEPEIFELNKQKVYDENCQG